MPWKQSQTVAVEPDFTDSESSFITSYPADMNSKQLRNRNDEITLIHEGEGRRLNVKSNLEQSCNEPATPPGQTQPTRPVLTASTHSARGRAIHALNSLSNETRLDPRPQFTPEHRSALAKDIGLLLSAGGSFQSNNGSRYQNHQVEEGSFNGTRHITENQESNTKPKRDTEVRIFEQINGGEKLLPIRKYDLPRHPLEDRSDAAFQELFKDIYQQTLAFSRFYFGIHDIKSNVSWAGLTMPPGFLQYAELVAEADPACGGWNDLLIDMQQRQWFITAILTRIFEINIFSDVLFGANEREKELLRGLDKALLTQEGFSRQAIRAKTVRAFLGQSPTTEKFWPEVARLTDQISKLLESLTDLLYSGLRVNEALPSRKNQYQTLLNLVASVAYVSICIRLSSDIIYFTNIKPGEPYDPDEQHCLDLDLYKKSKEAVQKYWAEGQKRARNKARAATGEMTGVLGVVQHVAVDQPVFNQAMTKIAVWPAIRRYKPGSGKKGGENDGFRVYDICKSAVVCYFGNGDQVNARRESLQEFLAGGARKNGDLMSAQSWRSLASVGSWRNLPSRIEKIRPQVDEFRSGSGRNTGPEIDVKRKWFGVAMQGLGILAAVSIPCLIWAAEFEEKTGIALNLTGLMRGERGIAYD